MHRYTAIITFRKLKIVSSVHMHIIGWICVGFLDWAERHFKEKQMLFLHCMSCHCSCMQMSCDVFTKRYNEVRDKILMFISLQIAFIKITCKCAGAFFHKLIFIFKKEKSIFTIVIHRLIAKPAVIHNVETITFWYL